MRVFAFVIVAVFLFFVVVLFLLLSGFLAKDDLRFPLSGCMRLEG